MNLSIYMKSHGTIMVTPLITWGWDMRRYKGTSWDTDGAADGKNIALKAKKNPVPLVRYRVL